MRKMDILLKPANSVPQKKRKRKSKTKFTTSENKARKVDTSPVPGAKTPKSILTKVAPHEEASGEETGEKFPILKNHDLVSKFLKVPMTNNQKGRIRQAIRESLQGTSNVLVPEIIHNKIQSILKSSPNLTDSELRRIRILYNLLKTSLKEKKVTINKASIEAAEKPKKSEKGNAGDVKVKEKDDKKKEKADKREQLVKKVKGPKRYVVFLGNLPLDVDKDKIINHFSEMNEHILDVRIPKPEGKKSAIAYLELSNEPSYEFALSKHHSMLGSKRINVLYTAPKKGKVMKATAKSKSAKLIALQKKGKLVGSIPLAKKRSQRRLKMKKAQAELAAQNP